MKLHRGICHSLLFALALTVSSPAPVQAETAAAPPNLAPIPHEDTVNIIVYSPDGSLIASCDSSEKLYLWDARTHERIGETMMHESYVREVVFSPDGSRIATTSHDGKSRLWDARSGKLIGEAMQHSEEFRDLCFSPDGSFFAVACKDGTIRLRDGITGRLLRTLEHPGPIFSIDISPDSSRLASAVRSVIRLWDPHSGKLIASLNHQGEHTAFFRFNADGSRIGSWALYGDARLWDGHSGEAISGVLQQDSYLEADFSADGRIFATTSSDCELRLWDARNGQSLGKPLTFENPVFCISFSPDGDNFATISGQGTFTLWDTRTGNPIADYVNHDGDDSMPFVLYNAGADCCLAFSYRNPSLWDPRTGVSIGENLSHDKPVLTACFSPDGRVLAYGGSDKLLYFREIPAADRQAAPDKR